MLPAFQLPGCELQVPETFKCSIAELQPIINDMSLVDLNKVLYRSNTEEGDDGNGGGLYNIPGYGDMVYCGLQGRFI